jgi:hypothetical protein
MAHDRQILRKTKYGRKREARMKIKEMRFSLSIDLSSFVEKWDGFSNLNSGRKEICRCWGTYMTES